MKVTIEDLIELSIDNKKVMVVVADKPYMVTDIDFATEEGFNCIDKECDEFWFEFGAISSAEAV